MNRITVWMEVIGMGIFMEINNVKNIDHFEFEIPTVVGVYALNGENKVISKTICPKLRQYEK